jgi:hypothetical protein
MWHQLLFGAAPAVEQRSVHAIDWIADGLERIIMTMDHRQIEAEPPAQRLAVAGDADLAVGQVRVLAGMIGEAWLGVVSRRTACARPSRSSDAWSGAPLSHGGTPASQDRGANPGSWPRTVLVSGAQPGSWPLVSTITPLLCSGN